MYIKDSGLIELKMGEENIVLGMEIYMWEGFIKE
jgi:hypothetical protein